ncbi:MAG TPA: hypothetical protein VHM20_04240 [Gammaproteobacteria bacterium]|jgi:uncharacterized protein YjbJ (UPF0337 family)|nr:hypothetical protein [Gammaproteobacteria bacterium]
MDYINSIIQGNWKQMKGMLSEQWDKLTEDDIEDINGEYEKLKDKLQSLYHYKTAKIEKEILEFIYSNNLNELGSKTKNKMQELKNSMVSTLDEYFGSAKEKTIDLEKSIAECVSKNPFKVAGIAAVIGLAVGLICKNK